MFSTVETISPNQAVEILTTRNAVNRPLSRERVRRYAAEMREGRWVLSPDGISFDSGGQLLNGQHRLSAVVLSGLPCRFYVHHEVPAEARRGFDQALGRTAAQMASMEIESPLPSSRLTTAARPCLEYGYGTPKPTNNQIVAFARDHQEVIERYAQVGKLFTGGVHAAFVFADLSGLSGLVDAAERLAEMRWGGDDDPMRALARALGTMGGREGARAQKTRFHTTLAALDYVDRGEPLYVARKYESAPPRVRDSVQSHLASLAPEAQESAGA